MSFWNVYADFDRRLSVEERGKLFAAMDATIPNSGCIGPNRSGVEEAYFTIEAATAAAAQVAATVAMERVVESSGVCVAFVIPLADITQVKRP